MSEDEGGAYLLAQALEVLIVPRRGDGCEYAGRLRVRLFALERNRLRLLRRCFGSLNLGEVVGPGAGSARCSLRVVPAEAETVSIDGAGGVKSKASVKCLVDDGMRWLCDEVGKLYWLDALENCWQRRSGAMWACLACGAKKRGRPWPGAMGSVSPSKRHILYLSCED